LIARRASKKLLRTGIKLRRYGWSAKVVLKRRCEKRVRTRCHTYYSKDHWERTARKNFGIYKTEEMTREE